MDGFCFPYPHSPHARPPASRRDIANIIIEEMVDDFMAALYPYPLIIQNRGDMKYHYHYKYSRERVMYEFPVFQYL